MALAKVSASRSKGTYESSGVVTATGNITTTSCIIGAFVVIDDGTNAATIEIYDSADTSGKKTIKWVTGGDGLPTGWEGIELKHSTAVHVVITTVGTAEVIVLYRED